MFPLEAPGQVVSLWSEREGSHGPLWCGRAGRPPCRLSGGGCVVRTQVAQAVLMDGVGTTQGEAALGRSVWSWSEERARPI